MLCFGIISLCATQFYNSSTTSSASAVPLRFKGSKSLQAARKKLLPSKSFMRQPTDQQERNEDKKKPEENPSRGIDPETKEPEMEANEPEKKKDAA